MRFTVMCSTKHKGFTRTVGDRNMFTVRNPENIYRYSNFCHVR